MPTWNLQGKYRYFFIAVLFLLAVSIVAYALGLFEKKGHYQIYKKSFHDYLMEKLVHNRPPPMEKAGDPTASPYPVYILGGGQESMNYKFRIVGRLHKEGRIRKIIVPRTPGLTEFSPSLGRYYSNDEWTFMELGEEGVSESDVELVSFPSSFFGTFGEARGVSNLIGLRGGKGLVLVTSRHHTMRAWLAFSHFKKDFPFELYIYGSEEEAGLYELLAECCKLIFYKYLLLPAERKILSFHESGSTSVSPSFLRRGGSGLG